MKSIFKVIVAITICSLSPFAVANVISTEVTLAATGEVGSVQLIDFSVLVAGDFDIDAQGSPSLGAGYNHDPMMYLFADDGVLGTDDLLASNDDFFGFESHIDIILGIGSYILSVSEFYFDVNQAISGIEDTIDWPYTMLRATISSDDGVASFEPVPEPEITPVPEPGTLALLGLGLVGMAARRRKV